MAGGEQRIKVASVADLPEGKHKAFTFTGSGDDATQVLLSNLGGKGKIYANSAKCTHYGAPLENGVLTASGRVVCPWHGACFDVKTGDIEDAPALDDILSFKVELEGEDIYVTADPEKLKGKPGVAPTCKASVKSDGKGLVVVGGGSGAINVVEAARKVSSYALRAKQNMLNLTRYPRSSRPATRNPSPLSPPKLTHPSTEQSSPRVS
jgi:apoptosis-inducing factor 3